MRAKKWFSFALVLLMLICIVPPTTASAEGENIYMLGRSPEGYEYAVFPLKCGHFSQLRFTNGSHSTQNAVDWVPLTREGTATTSATVYAPFTGKIVNDNTAGYGLVVFQSDDKVVFADGTVDIMTIKFAHDNNADSYKRNTTILQGEPLCSPGTAGGVGYHTHIAVQKGAWDGSLSGSGNYNIEDALFLDEDWTYDWTQNTGSCYYYNRLNWTALPMGYLSECIFFPANFTVKVKEDHEKIWSLPTIGTGTDEKSVALTEIVPKGTELTVLGIYLNTYDNYWYKVTGTVGGKTISGFFNSGYTDYSTISFNNWVRMEDYAAPTALNIGKTFNIKGYIYSNGCRISKITTYIYEGDGSSGNAVYSPSINVNTYEYEIGGDPVLDWQLYFNYLPAGNYTYAVKAQVENDYTTASKKLVENYSEEILLFSQSFQVS